jgi:hypothetical protein
MTMSVITTPQPCAEHPFAARDQAPRNDICHILTYVRCKVYGLGCDCAYLHPSSPKAGGQHLSEFILREEGRHSWDGRPSRSTKGGGGLEAQSVLGAFCSSLEAW